MVKNYKEGQSTESVAQNIAFFRDNIDSYNTKVQNLDSYITMRSYINNAINGIDHLLDIGNGGVFDYEVSLVNKITGLDLFLDKLPSSFICPPNVTLRTGSALDIPETAASFDGVLMVMLIHHLIGKNVESSINNVRTVINESYRVLKPGGKLIIVESCIPEWFYQLEKFLFPLVAKTADKIIGHPATLQYPIAMLKKILATKFNHIDIVKIPLGRWVMIFGKKVPAFLTPVMPIIFIAEKI